MFYDIILVKLTESKLDFGIIEKRKCYLVLLINVTKEGVKADLLKEEYVLTAT